MPARPLSAQELAVHCDPALLDAASEGAELVG